VPHTRTNEDAGALTTSSNPLPASSATFSNSLRLCLKSADEPGETCEARLLKWQLRGFSALSDPAKDALRTSLPLPHAPAGTFQTDSQRRHQFSRYETTEAAWCQSTLAVRDRISSVAARPGAGIILRFIAENVARRLQTERGFGRLRRAVHDGETDIRDFDGASNERNQIA